MIPTYGRVLSAIEKAIPGTCGGVPRSWEVPPGLGKGPGEEHRPIGETWGRNGVEMGLRGREREGGEQR